MASKPFGKVCSSFSTPLMSSADLWGKFRVWAGISGMSSWLSANVTSFFQGIIGSITGFLGINSPSKLFRDLVGRNIALGVAEGINAEMPNVIGGAKRQMTLLSNAAAQSAKLSRTTQAIYAQSTAQQSGVLTHTAGAAQTVQTAQTAGGSQNQNIAMPEIKVVMESTGAARDVFEALSIGIKRYDYLNGGIT